MTLVKEQITLKVTNTTTPILTQSIIDATGNIKLPRFELRLFRSIVEERLHFIGKANMNLTLLENQITEEEWHTAIEWAKRYISLHTDVVAKNQLPELTEPEAPETGF